MTKLKKQRNSKARMEKPIKSNFIKDPKDVVFSDVVHYPTFKLKSALKNVDIETIGIAIIGVSDDIKDAILSRLGRRDLIKFEELAFDFTTIMQSDIVSARKIILAEMRKVL